MKPASRDLRLGLAILVALLLTSILAATQRKSEQQYPELTAISAAPDGALALKLWVAELGYTVTGSELQAEFTPPKDATILFMLEPLFVTGAEVEVTDDWVDQGGTLILVSDQYSMLALADHYGFALRYLPNRDQPLQPALPLLTSPSNFQANQAQVGMALEAQQGDYVSLLTAQGQPVLVAFDQGAGRVILGTTTHLFTNAGLKESGNAEVVLNLLALARQRGPVWFDDWHHGLTGTQLAGPSDFMRRTPIGRALLFVTFAVFITLWLQGRGFGRPVPLPQELHRRGAIEHIIGIANLNRRAAHRAAVLQQYRQQLKRKLGQRYRLDPGMDDESYVDMLAGYNPAIHKPELLNLLKRLQRSEVSETELVHLTREAAKWIDA